MKATVLFRILAVIFVLFAAGHTAGFLNFKPPTAEVMAVKNAMDNVHFVAQGKAFSYGGWYRGFGLTATFAMLFQAFFAWHLGSMAKRKSPDVKPLGWALFAWQLPGLVLSVLWFPIPALVFTAIVAVVIAVATVLA
jgi:hypothetical protein